MSAVTTAIRILGGTAHLTYRLDETEHARRQADGMPDLRNLGTCDGLMNYPEGLPVPLTSLNQGQRTLVARGLLELDGDSVIRRIRPPLQLDFACVHAKGWQDGLNRASRFAPFCNRGMVLRKLPKDPSKLTEADFYGINVYVPGPDGELEQVVATRPYVRYRHTPAHWWFIERVYQQAADVLAAVPSGGTP